MAMISSNQSESAEASYLPWPRQVSGACLLQILQLDRNAQLRRKLHSVLEPLGPELWSARGQFDPEYGDSLLHLLRIPGGYQRYCKAIENDKLPLSSEGRLRLEQVLPRKAIAAIRTDGELPDRPEFDLLEKLLDGAHIIEAAMLIWLEAVKSADPAASIRDAVSRYPKLNGAFSGLAEFAPAKQAKPTAQLVQAITDLLPTFTPTDPPTAAQAIKLRDMAAELAERLTEEESQAAREAERSARRDLVRLAVDSLSTLDASTLPAHLPPLSKLPGLLADSVDGEEIEALLMCTRAADAAIRRRAEAKIAYDRGGRPNSDTAISGISA